MVCYARPAFRMAAIVVIALLAFSRPLGHFLGTAEFMAFMSTRRRRAAAGGCVN